MTRRQNLHYRISSQEKLKTEDEYVPKSTQIKLELAVEKGTNEGEAFQALSEKHSQVIAKFYFQLKYLVIESGDLNIIEKKKLDIISFVESIHDISEGFLTYYDIKDIDAHLCLIEVIEFYINHIAVHLEISKERTLKEYKKKYELEEMPRAYVTCPLATAPAAAPPDRPACPKNFGEQNRRLLNERAAAAASTDNTSWSLSKTDPLKQSRHPSHIIL